MDEVDEERVESFGYRCRSCGRSGFSCRGARSSRGGRFPQNMPEKSKGGEFNREFDQADPLGVHTSNSGDRINIKSLAMVVEQKDTKFVNVRNNPVENKGKFDFTSPDYAVVRCVRYEW